MYPLERAVEKNQKLESFKLECFCLSLKEPSKVGKDRVKLEKTVRSWKELSKVGKFILKLESFAAVLAENFQLRRELSNFNHSNFISDFPTTFIPHVALLKILEKIWTHGVAAWSRALTRCRGMAWFKILDLNTRCRHRSISFL